MKEIKVGSDFVSQLCAALCCACGKVAYSCCYMPPFNFTDFQNYFKNIS